MGSNGHSWDRAHRQSMAELLRTGDYSDLKFKCGDMIMPVHRNILCKASPVIDAETKKEWKESATGIIEHTVYSASTAFRMLQFMYTGDYEQGKIRGNEGAAAQEEPAAEAPVAKANAKLIVHIHVRAIADYYDVKTLVSYAEDKYKAALNDKIDTTGFMQVIKTVCELCPPGSSAFEATVQATRRNIKTLYNDAAVTEALASDQSIQRFAACLIDKLMHIKDNLLARSYNADLIEQNAAGFEHLQYYLCKVANTHNLRCTRCASSFNQENKTVWQLHLRPNHKITCTRCHSVLHDSTLPTRPITKHSADEEALGEYGDSRWS